MLDSDSKRQLRPGSDLERISGGGSFIGKIGNRFADLVSVLENIFLTLSGMLIVVNTALLSWEIIQRKLFNKSLLGIEEIVELSMILITFLSLSSVQSKEGHLKIDLIYNMILKTSLGPKLRIVILSISCIFFVVFFIVSLQFVLKMYSVNEFTNTLHLPKFIFYSAIPLGASVFIVRLVLMMKKYKFKENS